MGGYGFYFIMDSFFDIRQFGCVVFDKAVCVIVIQPPLNK